ncbi:MAG: helix-turn-helix domain-containing protein [Paracoccaceae bacterium]
MSTACSHPGLPDGVTPYDLIDVLEKLRSRLGLRDEDIAYLRCAFRLVRAEDFLPGRICAFWERVAGLADRLGVNVRRITRIETRLEGCGLIQRTGATNGRRFGRQAVDGRILSAGGINLAPLIERAGELLTPCAVS